MCKATTHPRRPRLLMVIAGANSPRPVTTTLHNLPFRAWERSTEVASYDKPRWLGVLFFPGDPTGQQTEATARADTSVTFCTERKGINRSHFKVYARVIPPCLYCYAWGVSSAGEAGRRLGAEVFSGMRSDTLFVVTNFSLTVACIC